MGTLAAGIKEIFATAKTTGSNVMLCGNDGTPDGHMTMANLASVLGVIQRRENTLSDAHSSEIGFHYVNAGATNVPTTGMGYYRLAISTKSYPNDITFLLYDYTNNRLYSAQKDEQGNVTQWQRLDNFGCNSLSDLANALGEIPPFYNHGIYSDSPNTLFYHGVYFVAPHADNPDTTSQWIICVLTCELNSANFGVQLAFAVDNNHAYYRMIWGNHIHGTWIALN